MNNYPRSSPNSDRKMAEIRRSGEAHQLLVKYPIKSTPSQKNINTKK